MAETLGSLVDKLVIVDLKLWHCQELLFNKKEEPSPEEIKKLEIKNESLSGQRQRLIKEIDGWILDTIKDPENAVISNPQNKIYGQFRKD